VTYDGLILYGPPASGKDAVSAALIASDPRYVLFERLKAGSGRTHGYRSITHSRLHALDVAGLLLYVNNRYGNTYAIDRPGLDHIMTSSQVPIVHLGQVADLKALTGYPAKWLTVLLWCARGTSAERLHDRGDTDVEARMTAWDDTCRDVLTAPPAAFALALRTDHMTPHEAAHRIDAAMHDPDNALAWPDLADIVTRP